MTLEFRVYGLAQPKGSTRAFMRPGMKFPIVTDSNRNAKSWSQLVAHAVSDHLNAGDAPSFYTRPLRVSIAFALPRPKAIKLKAVAHVRKPDIDKLIRGVLDALSGVLYHDDAQVVDVRASKRYIDVGDLPHATIRIDVVDGIGDGLFDLERREAKC